MSGNHELELLSRKRFGFGQNWYQYLNDVNEIQILEAEKSLKKYLKLDTLSGYSFLDVGCGSGIFSLAARRLGAKVTSFDYDPKSVECAEILKKRFFSSDDADWIISQGSILDFQFISKLGNFDIVYSWGVLHHTGEMWAALKNSLVPLLDGGLLFISIYNDQGRKSFWWRLVKKYYVKSPLLIKKFYELFFLILLWAPSSLRDLIFLRPFSTWNNYSKYRGMSPYIDLVDWIGGYPFEVASPDKIFEYFSNENLNLKHLKTCGGGHGCNEYVFIKNKQAAIDNE